MYLTYFSQRVQAQERLSSTNVSFSSLCLHSLLEKRIIQRYITLHPKLEASQELKKIMTRLKYSDEMRFTKALDIWYIKYKDFLNEITIHPDSGKYSFRDCSEFCVND